MKKFSIIFQSYFRRSFFVFLSAPFEFSISGALATPAGASTFVLQKAAREVELIKTTWEAAARADLSESERK
jgi:hypothetical protein